MSLWAYKGHSIFYILLVIKVLPYMFYSFHTTWCIENIVKYSNVSTPNNILVYNRKAWNNIFSRLHVSTLPFQMVDTRGPRNQTWIIFPWIIQPTVVYIEVKLRKTTGGCLVTDAFCLATRHVVIKISGEINFLDKVRRRQIGVGEIREFFTILGAVCVGVDGEIFDWY